MTKPSVLSRFHFSTHVVVIVGIGSAPQFSTDLFFMPTDGETERRKCYWLRCGAGRKCVIDERGEEECICIDEESCPAGHGLVCGSDGVMYESHCMLHRAACLLNKNIFADRLGEACLQRGQQLIMLTVTEKVES
mgnify:CR=1 FL=1